MPKIGICTAYENEVEVAFEWKIENFFNLPEKDGTFYSSPGFTFAGERWQLWMCPNGSSARKSSGFVDLSLSKKPSSRSIRQSFSFSLKTVAGKNCNKQHFSEVFANTKWICDFIRIIRRFQLTLRRSELMPEGVLTVVCTMKKNTSTAGKENSENTCVEASTQTEQKNSDASGLSTSHHEKKVLNDLKKLFLQNEDTDVIIKVKGSEFKAHRFILKARSPVFASIFRHNMKENLTGIMEIEDCDPSSFLDFLSFLYCGDIGMITRENVFSLFTAADKYEVQDLKKECLEFLKKNMTIDSFCETIILALQHSETELISLATDFFVKNAEEILLTVKWQIFAADNPTQSNELVLKFVRSVKQ